jgi:hypothetical protein
VCVLGYASQKEIFVIQLKQLLIFILFTITITSGCASDEEKKLSHFEKGRSYLEAGEYKSAVLEFKNAIQVPLMGRRRPSEFWKNCE